MESKHLSRKMLSSQFIIYFNEAFHEYLCCDSEAVNYVLKFLVENEKDDILSIIMYKFWCTTNLINIIKY